MLIMRMYALYERSRKVLAFYVVIVVIAMALGCVSLNLRRNQYPVWHPIADVGVYSGQQWVPNKMNSRTGQYPQAAIQIWVKNSKY